VARKVLLDIDAELLTEFDAMWRACGFPSRRAAVRHQLSVAVAQHRAIVSCAREPNPWAPRAVTLTGDGAGSRPLTADLADS
jgi:hypothetical protein